MLNNNNCVPCRGLLCWVRCFNLFNLRCLFIDVIGSNNHFISYRFVWFLCVCGDVIWFLLYVIIIIIIKNITDTRNKISFDCKWLFVHLWKFWHHKSVFSYRKKKNWSEMCVEIWINSENRVCLSFSISERLIEFGMLIDFDIFLSVQSSEPVI